MLRNIAAAAVFISTTVFAQPLLSENVTVTTVAGSGGAFWADGVGTGASFNHPRGVVALPNGTGLAVVDHDNNRIRVSRGSFIAASEHFSLRGGGAAAADVKHQEPPSPMHALRAMQIISSVWSVSTIAGSGSRGFAEGWGPAAKFAIPRGLAVNSSGFIFVADCDNHRIRVVDPQGSVTTLAGSSTSGSTDGVGSQASFVFPYGVALEPGPTGRLIVADADAHRVRAVTLSGVVTTLAGNGWGGYRDGFGTAAQVNYPNGVAVDQVSGIIFLADSRNHRIRAITPDGVVTTLAGSGAVGGADGNGTLASFNYPVAVATDSCGNVYVAESDGQRIRFIDIGTGFVATLAGTGALGSSDGRGSVARFAYPYGIGLDPASATLYVADTFNNKIRAIALRGGSPCYPLPGASASSTPRPSRTPSATPTATASAPTRSPTPSSSRTPGTATVPQANVSTWAGSGYGFWADGYGTGASFSQPRGVAVVPGGALAGALAVADSQNHRIRLVLPNRSVLTLAGSGAGGFADGLGSAAKFDFPRGVAADDAGNIFVADCNNRRIRKISPAGDVTTLAGSGASGSGDGIDSIASFVYPYGISLEARAGGRIIVADADANLLRAVSRSGIVSTLAGSGRASFADGLGRTASFNYPNGVAVDALTGTIYVADTRNHRIRAVSADGDVTTLAGSGSAGAGDGYGRLASFSNPVAVATDSCGNVYVAESDGQRIRFIDIGSGFVKAFAGTGTLAFSDGPASSAGFSYPSGLVIDPATATLLVGDTFGHKIRAIGLRGASTCYPAPGASSTPTARPSPSPYPTPDGYFTPCQATYMTMAGSGCASSFGADRCMQMCAQRGFALEPSSFGSPYVATASIVGPAPSYSGCCTPYICITCTTQCTCPTATFRHPYGTRVATGTLFDTVQGISYVFNASAGPTQPDGSRSLRLLFPDLQCTLDYGVEAGALGARPRGVYAADAQDAAEAAALNQASGGSGGGSSGTDGGSMSPAGAAVLAIFVILLAAVGGVAFAWWSARKAGRFSPGMSLHTQVFTALLHTFGRQRTAVTTSTTAAAGDGDCAVAVPAGGAAARTGSGLVFIASPMHAAAAAAPPAAARLGAAPAAADGTASGAPSGSWALAAAASPASYSSTGAYEAAAPVEHQQAPAGFEASVSPAAPLAAAGSSRAAFEPASPSAGQPHAYEPATIRRPTQPSGSLDFESTPV